jgi:hypothetical protein
MFAMLLSRGEPTRARKRPPPDRVVGCCPDATLLLPDAVLLDEICAHAADPGVPSDVVAALADRDELRVPATVTSFDPYGGPLREVTLRP